MVMNNSTFQEYFWKKKRVLSFKFDDSEKCTEQELHLEIYVQGRVTNVLGKCD